MICPKCGHENPEAALAGCEAATTSEALSPQASVCQQCGAPLDTQNTAAGGDLIKMEGVRDSAAVAIGRGARAEQHIHYHSTASEEKKPPMEVPGQSPHFIGRQAEKENFAKFLAGGAQKIAIVGMGGLGKTELAKHLAGSVRDQFPGGVLWADVAGRDSLAIINGWLDAFGCTPGGEVDRDGRAARLRSILADKKALIVLDDVQDLEMVKPLLPGISPSVTLLTTQDLDIAQKLATKIINLPTLSDTEAFTLLAHIVGEERVGEEVSAAQTICKLLSNLPMAVEIAAQILRFHQYENLAGWASELKARGLDVLRFSGDEIRTIFELSLERLQQAYSLDARYFALLGVFDGRVFTTAAFAAVGEIEHHAANEILQTLVAVSLLDEIGRGRYVQHRLLAEFAARKLGKATQEKTRMAHHYLAYARENTERYVELEGQWTNLIASIQVLHAQQDWQAVMDFVSYLQPAWFARGHYIDARRSYRWAVEAAAATGNERAQAYYLHEWGRACINQSDYAEAEDLLNASLQLDATNENQSAAKYLLAEIAVQQNHFDLARTLLDEAQKLQMEAENWPGLAKTHYLKAFVHYYMGEFTQAQQLISQALRQQKDREPLAYVRSLILAADILLERKEPTDSDQAITYCQQAIEICQQIEEQSNYTTALYSLAVAYMRQGRLQEALGRASESLALAKCMGERQIQAQILDQLCRLEAELQHFEEAFRHGEQSWRLCEELEDNLGLAHVSLHIGDAYQQAGQTEQAIKTWQKGLVMAEQLGHGIQKILRERLESSA